MPRLYPHYPWTAGGLRARGLPHQCTHPIPYPRSIPCNARELAKSRRMTHGKTTAPHHLSLPQTQRRGVVASRGPQPHSCSGSLLVHPPLLHLSLALGWLLQPLPGSGPPGAWIGQTVWLLLFTPRLIASPTPGLTLCATLPRACQVTHSHLRKRLGQALQCQRKAGAGTAGTTAPSMTWAEGGLHQGRSSLSWTPSTRPACRQVPASLGPHNVPARQPGNQVQLFSD